MHLITKMLPHVYMQRIYKNRDIYYDVKTLKCTNVPTFDEKYDDL